MAVDGSDDHSEEAELIVTTAQRNKGKDKMKVVEDSSESEQGEELDDEVPDEGGEDEMSGPSESDADVSSSEDDLLVTVEKSKKSEAARRYADESSDPDEEVKEPPKKRVAAASQDVKEIASQKKAEKGEIEVDFLYVCPSPAYYHNVKALLNQYLDGDHGE